MARRNLNMDLLVTGATGRIGSRLVPRLQERGDAIRVLLRREEQADAFQERGVQVAIGDLRQADTLTQAVSGVEAVIHLAAFFRGATPEEAHAINYAGTLALARAAQQAGVSKFVYISTNLVYGPGRGRPAREDDEPQPAPDHFYPVSKLAAEQALAQLYKGRQTELCILRLAFVYGEGDPHFSEAVNFTRSWPAAKRLHLVHHADVDQGIMLSLDKPAAGGQIYNVADDTPITIAEIRRLNGLPVPENAMDNQVDDPWEGIVDTTKIKTELGFRPRYPSVYSAIKTTVA
jgi:nucleoside-diphosphate-sugar epimerase